MDFDAHWERVYQTRRIDEVSWFRPHLDTSLEMIEKAGRPAETSVLDVGGGASRDVTRLAFPRARFNVWHDRAVFHFLTEPTDRQRYLERMLHALAPGGHVILATFGPEGPQRCSGLPTSRYDADSLRGVLGDRFELVETRLEQHRTPSGAEQQFLYCL